MFESALKRAFAAKLSLEIDVAEPTDALNFAVIRIIGLLRPDSCFNESHRTLGSRLLMQKLCI